MKQHTAQWLIFTVIFALIPLLVFSLFSLVLNTPEKIYDKFIHELFFYSTMVSSAAINDLLHVPNTVRDSTRFTVAFGFLIVFIIASTSIYGVIVFTDDFISTDIINIHRNTLFIVSILLSFFTTVISFFCNKWRY